MSNDKNRDFQENLGTKEGDYSSESSTRARNRTVMLTPEITGQVRARLAQEMEPSPDFAPPTGRTDTPAMVRPTSGGFTPPSSGPVEPAPAMYTPAGRPPSLPEHAPVAREPVARARPTSNQLVVWAKETPIVGFLVSFDNNPNGDVYELRSGRLIISSEPATGGSYIVVEDESVSPMHAILRISTTGEVQVLDQLSEFGTHIKRFGVEEEEHISGEKSTIEHGDIIKFGSRVFHVCILALES